LVADLETNGDGIDMMYPLITLDDQTEIVHSEMQQDGTVKVYIEKPHEKDCFHYATCYLPGYKWDDIYGFTGSEIERYQEVLESLADLINDSSQR
jgi:hypothetical protein